MGYREMILFAWIGLMTDAFAFDYLHSELR